MTKPHASFPPPSLWPIPVLASPRAADLLCRQKRSIMRRRPRPWLATLAGDLTPRPKTEVQMPAFNDSRPKRLRLLPFTRYRSLPVVPEAGARRRQIQG